MKRLNRFLNWAEGWAVLVTFWILIIWNVMQGRHIDDLQTVLFAQVAATQDFTTRHLDFHGELSSFHDRIVDFMADIILEDIE